VLWIRIRKDPHHFSNLDPHPDPHPDPHQIKIRNRAVHGDQVVLELLPKSEWKAEGTALVQVTSLLSSVVDPHTDPLLTWIRIRIRIRIKQKSGTGPYTATKSSWSSCPRASGRPRAPPSYRLQAFKQWIRIRIRIRVRIRIK
jgi:exoribonuclease R